MVSKPLKNIKKSEGYKIRIERSNGELHVNMSNALASAAQGLSLAEKRIMCLAIGKLDSKQRVNPMNPPTVKISAAEFAETFEVDLKKESALKTIKNKSKNG